MEQEHTLEGREEGEREYNDARLRTHPAPTPHTQARASFPPPRHDAGTYPAPRVTSPLARLAQPRLLCVLAAAGLGGRGGGLAHGVEVGVAGRVEELLGCCALLVVVPQEVVEEVDRFVALRAEARRRGQWWGVGRGGRETEEEGGVRTMYRWFSLVMNLLQGFLA